MSGQLLKRQSVISLCTYRSLVDGTAVPFPSSFSCSDELTRIQCCELSLQRCSAAVFAKKLKIEFAMVLGGDKEDDGAGQDDAEGE